MLDTNKQTILDLNTDNQGPNSQKNTINFILKLL